MVLRSALEQVMRTAACICCFTCLLVLVPSSPAHPAAAVVVEGYITHLVKQLGDPDFATREAAQKKLRQLELLALPQLVKGLRNDSQEVVMRSTELIKELRPKAMPLVRELKTDPSIDFRSVKFSRDGKLIAACGEFGVHIWEVESGRSINRVELKNYIHYSLEFTADGKRLWIGGDGGIISLDIATGKFKWFLQDIRTNFDNLLLAPDGKSLLAVGRDHLHVLDASTGKKLQDVKVSPYRINEIKLSPDGKTIAAACPSLTVALIDFSEGKLIREWKIAADRPLKPEVEMNEHVASVAWAPDGKSLACGTGGMITGGEIHIRDLEGKLIRQWQAHFSGAGHLTFIGNGRLLLSTGSIAAKTGSDVVAVWNPDEGKGCGLHRLMKGESRYQLAVFEERGLFALVGYGTVHLRRLPHPAWSVAPFIAIYP
jgi:WD40 repeat protein